MSVAGLIEPGFFRAACVRKATFVRTAKTKPTPNSLGTILPHPF